MKLFSRVKRVGELKVYLSIEKDTDLDTLLVFLGKENIPITASSQEANVFVHTQIVDESAKVLGVAYVQYDSTESLYVTKEKITKAYKSLK